MTYEIQTEAGALGPARFLRRALISKPMRPYIEALEKNGCVFESISNRGKHPKVIFTTPQGATRKLPIPKTPGKFNRGVKNFQCLIRRVCSECDR